MRYLICLLLGLSSASFAAAPVSEATDQQRLERLERRIGKITELTLQLDGLKQENRKLHGEIETLNHQIEQLKRKQRDMYRDIDQRFAAVAGGNPAPATPSVVETPVLVAPVPTETPTAAVNNRPPTQPATATVGSQPAAQAEADYAAAYALLSPAQRRYKEAIQAFEGFLQKYPKSPLAGNAQYWLGEAHYVSQDNAAALQAFDKVASDYPNSSKVPGALYKIGRIHQVKGDLDAARATLQRITRDYPNSSAASLAHERLAELNHKP